MFLEDEDYTGAMEELLAEGYCAEYAVDQAGEQFSAMLAAHGRPLYAGPRLPTSRTSPGAF